MWNQRGDARIIGALGGTSLLGGCSALPGDGLFATAALVLTAAAAAAAGWLAGRRRGRQALHAARQDARLVTGLAGGEFWRTTLTADGPPRLQDGRRLGEVFVLGSTAAQVEASLGGDHALGPFDWPLVAGGMRTVHALPWYEDDGRLGGHCLLARPRDGGGLAAQALQLWCEQWPDDLAVLTRRGDSGPWQLLQASPSMRRTLTRPAEAQPGPDAAAPGSPDLLDDAAVLSALPAAAAPLLGTAGEADLEDWRIRHTQVGDQALLLLARTGGSTNGVTTAHAGDDSATLSYTVSHDLRAPIRVVEGFTRIVKEDYGSTLDRVANDHLDRVLGATARMNQMIDAMLTLARLSSQPLARQPVNLSQLATFVAEDLRRAAPEREAVIQIEPELLVTGDPTLLRLVLENLLGNAWKYSAKRTQTHIVFGRETVDGRSAYVVRDNGAGFDMRSAERLFGLFQRLHSSSDFAGTGVGLASVRRIVQRHGGRVWADGEPGRGAAFYFTLRD